MQKIKGRNILVCTHVFPPDRGGISAFTRDLTVLFEDLGLRVNIHHRKKRGKTNRIVLYFKHVADLIGLFLKLFKNQYDYVFSTRLLPLGIFTIIAKPFIKGIVIVQVHGTELEGRYKKSRWRKYLIRSSYNASDQVWANSQNTVERLLTYGVLKSKIKLVYPFLTPDIHEVKSKEPESKETLRIFTAANLYHRKGIDLVLRSLSALKNYNWTYYIAGEFTGGGQNTYCQLASELGISHRVTFLGQLPRKELWKEMATSDLFVLTSRELPNDIESFGIVYIEAQYFGLPCIGTNTGGIPEAIGTGGFLIDNESISQLTRYLKLLMEDRILKKKLSEISAERVKQKFLMQVRQKEIHQYLVNMHQGR